MDVPSNSSTKTLTKCVYCGSILPAFGCTAHPGMVESHGDVMATESVAGTSEQVDFFPPSRDVMVCLCTQCQGVVPAMKQSTLVFEKVST